MPAPLDLLLAAIALASVAFALSQVDARGAPAGDDRLNNAILSALM